MPIPIERLRDLLALSIRWPDPAPSWADRAWGVAAWEPGEPPEDGPAAEADLTKRLRQSGRRWVPVYFVGVGGATPGIATPDMDRAAAVKLGYRLRRWAVYRIHREGLDPVFTGIGSPQ